MCDSVNHNLFPKEDHVPDCACRDKHGNKGDRVEFIGLHVMYNISYACQILTKLEFP